MTLPLWPILLGPDAIQPMIRSDKVAARVSDYGNIQIFHGVDYVGSEAIRVGQLVAGVVDAAVDAAAHVPGRR